jgi:hypothetical protein
MTSAFWWQIGNHGMAAVTPFCLRPGRVGQKFPNDEKNFRIFHGIRKHRFEVFKGFFRELSQYKQKYSYFMHRHITDWSNKPKNIYRFQCRRKHFWLGGGGRGVWKGAEGPRKLLNLESLKCHFLDLGGRFDRILMVRKQRFSTLKCTIWLQFSSFTICLQWAKAYLINYRIYWISCSRVYG